MRKQTPLPPARVVLGSALTIVRWIITPPCGVVGVRSALPTGRSSNAARARAGHASELQSDRRRGARLRIVMKLESDSLSRSFDGALSEFDLAQFSPEVRPAVVRFVALERAAIRPTTDRKPRRLGDEKP